MRAKQMLEKLQDLATYFTLAASDATMKSNESLMRNDYTAASTWEGRAIASNHAFEKMDALIKEAKQ